MLSIVMKKYINTFFFVRSLHFPTPTINMLYGNILKRNTHKFENKVFIYLYENVGVMRFTKIEGRRIGNEKVR